MLEKICKSDFVTIEDTSQKTRVIIIGYQIFLLGQSIKVPFYFGTNKQLFCSGKWILFHWNLASAETGDDEN